MVYSDYIAIIVVGAIWGCSNPCVRKGVSTNDSDAQQTHADDDIYHKDELASRASFFTKVVQSLYQFRRPSVFLPYLINQTGSVVYYKLAATADMTKAIPACSALSMVFSSITSYLFGERLDKPVRGCVGSILVLLGVIVCMLSKEQMTGVGSITNDEL